MIAQEQATPGSNRNGRIALICAGVVAGMVGMSYAAVPLYDAFCRITGYGGVTQTADAVSGEVLDRPMTVRFDASRARDMPWAFSPDQTEQTLKIGEVGLAFYTAENPTGRALKGMATYNVTPLKAGAYFVKLDCFCFQEQTLDAGEVADMPVVYFAALIADDPELDNVTAITLSYTFHVVGDEGGES